MGSYELPDKESLRFWKWRVSNEFIEFLIISLYVHYCPTYLNEMMPCASKRIIC